MEHLIEISLFGMILSLFFMVILVSIVLIKDML